MRRRLRDRMGAQRRPSEQHRFLWSSVRRRLAPHQPLGRRENPWARWSRRVRLELRSSLILQALPATVTRQVAPTTPSGRCPIAHRSTRQEVGWTRARSQRKIALSARLASNSSSSTTGRSSVSWHQSAPPGWYPDPSGEPMQRWWDGAQWTPHTQGWPGPPRQRSTAWLATALGGGAAFVGTFLPWVHVFLVGTLDLFQVVGKGGGSLLALLVIIGALVVVIVGIAERSTSAGPGNSTAALVISVCGAGLTGLWGIGLNADVRGATGFVSLGAGVFVTLAGFIVAAVAAGRSRIPAGMAPPSPDGPTSAPPGGWIDGPPGPPPPSSRNPGWYPDPWGSGRLRFWKGASWTRSVRHSAPGPADSNEDGPPERRPSSAAAGWYKDPWGVGTRYWNGTRWTTDVRDPRSFGSSHNRTPGGQQPADPYEDERRAFGGRPISPAPADTRPGWRPDPWGSAGRSRYWDGGSWGPDTR